MSDEIYHGIPLHQPNTCRTCEKYFPYKTPALGLCLAKTINVNDDYGGDCKLYVAKQDCK